MKPHTSEYYFFGEFGYLQQVVLASTERFVKAYPDLSGQVLLHTFEGNDYIFNALFPGYFQFHLIPLHPSRGGFYCGEVEKDYQEIRHISHMSLHDPYPNWLGDMPYGGDMSRYYLSSPIPTPSLPDLDAHCSNFSKIVVFYLRNRNMEPHRNFTEEDNYWNAMIKSHVQDPSTLCCIYSVNDRECLVPSYIDPQAANIRLIKTMEEACYFFNKCETAYMNDSGLVDLAKNCAVKHLVICPGSNGILFNGSLYYNPFNTRIEIFDRDCTFSLQL